MNATIKQKYGGAFNFFAQAVAAFLAVALALMFFCAGVWSGSGELVVAALLIITISGLVLNKQKATLFAVTLSVPELLTDVIDAFKLETPEVFGPNGFATDFSSKTAVLGDTVTAKISKIPVTGAYDRANGGFKNATQDVTTLMEDVPVTLNQFRIVTININWITQLASKIQLYEHAMKNYGYALAKYFIDTVLTSCVLGNFSNRIQVPLANVTLDTVDLTIRDQMNTQKMVDTGRFMIVNTPFASKFGSDDRVRNAQFGIDQRNGERGYRRWQNIGGLSWIREYPDFPTNGIDLQAFAAERRGTVVAARAIDFSNAADQLGIPKVQDFYPISDEQSGLPMIGTAWQEAGTGDVFLAAGILFGVGMGKQGGAAGTMTDNGGLLVTK